MPTNTNPTNAPEFPTPTPEPGPRAYARRLTEYVIAGAIMVLNVIGAAVLIAALVLSTYAIYWFTQRVLLALGGN